MKWSFASWVGAVIALAVVAELAGAQAHTLAIRHATVFDTDTRATRPETTILVRGDRITAVLPDAEARGIRATTEIDARGRLVTPGLIDVHHHLGFVFPDSLTAGGGAIARFVMHPDSIARYRERWARQFLQHGVTVVRSVGDNDAYMPLLTAWMRPSPAAPDFFTTGGALVSTEPERASYIDHSKYTEVRDSADAARAVERYYAAGLRDIKLYRRLREPELVGALAAAKRRNMAVTAHVGADNVSIRRALALGVRHLEHAHEAAPELLSREQQAAAWDRTRRTLGERLPAAFWWAALEMFNAIGADNQQVRTLIADIARSGATMTPTLHIFAQRVGVAQFKTLTKGTFDDDGKWTPQARARARQGYESFARYVRDLHRAGVPLAIGTDTFDPGAAALSEMLLLHQAGIPMADVLRIATLGGAQVMEREKDYGRIAPGRKAHFVLFDASPLLRPRALVGGKTVIKDGVVVSR
ncbi:MAG: amidohydrolase family protein [Gemmatimonadaceae bacterium]